MKRFAALLSVLLVMAGLGLSMPQAVAEKAKDKRLAKAFEKSYPVKDVEFKVPYLAGHRPFVNYGLPMGISFCGVDVKVESEGTGLKFTWAGDQTASVAKAGTTVTVTSGDESFVIGVDYSPEKGWGYFNAIYKEAKLDIGTVRFFDIDCNGKYTDIKTDCVMYGDRTYVIPQMPTQWYYEWNVEWEFFVDKKPMIKVKYTPLDLFPDERNAGVVLNDFRMNMGLPAVPIDPELSTKARNYAGFIAFQGGDMADWGIVQNPKPEHGGYHPDCLEMKNSYFFCFDDAPTAMADMIGQFFHRSQFFFPDTRIFGIGVSGAVSVFNGELTRDPEWMKWTYPIIVPGSEQEIRYYDYYGKYGGETPDPRPAGAGGSFPISLIWEHGPEELKVKEWSLTLIEGKKETVVDSYCFWPGRPAVPNYPDNEGQILILAAKPFKRGVRYKVSVAYTINGTDEKKEWFFTTAKK